MTSRLETLVAEGSDFELWQGVSQAAFELRRTTDSTSLTDVQRIALAVWMASGMISNRGFFDHTADEMNEWAAAYDALGLVEAAKAVREAAAIMPTISWDNKDPAEQFLDDIERRYYAADVNTANSVAVLIRQR